MTTARKFRVRTHGHLPVGVVVGTLTGRVPGTGPTVRNVVLRELLRRAPVSQRPLLQLPRNAVQHEDEAPDIGGELDADGRPPQSPTQRSTVTSTQVAPAEPALTPHVRAARGEPARTPATRALGDMPPTPAQPTCGVPVPSSSTVPATPHRRVVSLASPAQRPCETASSEPHPAACDAVAPASGVRTVRPRADNVAHMRLVRPRRAPAARSDRTYSWAFVPMCAAAAGLFHRNTQRLRQLMTPAVFDRILRGYRVAFERFAVEQGSMPPFQMRQQNEVDYLDAQSQQLWLQPPGLAAMNAHGRGNPHVAHELYAEFAEQWRVPWRDVR